MKYIILVVLVGSLACCCKPTTNQNTTQSESYWQQIDIKKSESLPNEFTGYRLDFNKLKSQINKNQTVLIPTLDGELMSYKLADSGTMSPELAAKYPEIKSYKIVKADNIISGRIDINPSGFYVMIVDQNSTYFINPVEKKGSAYICYDKLYALKNSNNPFIDQVIK
ncbi:MAG: hypothetical protein RLO81_03735 [Fulvivirga sp.]|uniref:hypothetical protein n=1 Tax=Fulvivirga sp. TaxID=1931237 RepID=UPI0032EB3732